MLASLSKEFCSILSLEVNIKVGFVFPLTIFIFINRIVLSTYSVSLKKGVSREAP